MMVSANGLDTEGKLKRVNEFFNRRIGWADDLAHQVELMVFAEGVETDAEIAIIKMLNFDGMTGKGINSFNN
jgi:hypothetical protein